MTDLERVQLKQFSANYTVTNDYFLENFPNKIDITRLLSIALETAGQHDRVINHYLKEPLLKTNESWVITQSVVEIERLPELNDELKVITRVIEVNRFFVKRQFEIMLSNILLLTILSQYAVLNLETRRMCRIAVDELVSVDAVDTSIAYQFDKLRVPEAFHSKQVETREIVESDIDYNQHVNNEVYIRWCHEMLPAEYNNEYQLAKIEVKYGSELRFDEEAEVVAYLPDASIMNNEAQGDLSLQTYQVIRNKSKDKDACYVRINWRAR